MASPISSNWSVDLLSKDLRFEFYLFPQPTGPMTPVSFPTGKWAFIFFSDDSDEPGYFAVKRLILCTFLGWTSVLKALFSRSGFIAWLDEESSGRRRISSIREQAFRSSANKVANMKMNRRLSSMIFRNIETANRSEALKSAIFELFLSQKFHLLHKILNLIELFLRLWPWKINWNGYCNEIFWAWFQNRVEETIKI